MDALPSSSGERPLLSVIVASTRPGRVGLPIAEWVAASAASHGAFRVQMLDLGQIDLPLMNEPKHPKLRAYQHEHTRRWSAMVDASDAFVVVTPEYNYGFTAPLKNALDYLHQEWRHKPMAFVSYGGVSAGTRAVQMLKQVVTTLKIVPMVEAVCIPFVTEYMGEDGTFSPNEPMTSAMQLAVSELVETEIALRELRERARRANRPETNGSATQALGSVAASSPA